MNKLLTNIENSRYKLAKILSPHLSKLIGYHHKVINYDWEHDPRPRPPHNNFQPHEEKNQIRWRLLNRHKINMFYIRHI